MASLASRAAGAALGLVLVSVQAGWSQATRWHLDAELATAHAAGGATGLIDEEETTVGAGRAFSFGVRVEQQSGRVGYGLAFRHSRPPFTLRTDDVTISDDELGFNFYQIAPELTLQLVVDDGGRSVQARIGPVIDMWRWEVTEGRTRLGARGGLLVALPVGSGFAATIGSAITLSGSPFEAEDLGSEFERDLLVRTELGVGLRYTLR